ncbi:uncharacterized protein LOC113219371 [Apis mellifera]|uniref:Uncharacterized protein LOC113219371 n=1 Tax=Apis mellifera TaxID=7460 RepID=A0A7M7MWC3_APIME|nr:uncharacterized protein LOC113219371 [Apis mellifera]|eukprot:XP_026301782.1 uncharacterized protein LOC113219371 [Apis mellifera]
MPYSNPIHPNTLVQCDSENDTGNICIVYRNDAITITTIPNWFKRYRAGNFDLKNEGTYSPATTNIDLIKAMLVENPRYNISKCIENVLDLRTIDLQLSQSLDFTRRKFFYPFVDIEKKKEIMRERDRHIDIHIDQNGSDITQ